MELKRLPLLSLGAAILLVAGCRGSKSTSGPTAIKDRGTEAGNPIANAPAANAPVTNAPPANAPADKDTATNAPGVAPGPPPTKPVPRPDPNAGKKTVTSKNPFGPGGIQRPVAGDWKTVAGDPVQVARRIDQRLKSLQNVGADTMMRVKLPGISDENRATFRTIVKDRKTFDIQYLALVNGLPTTGYARADGQSVAELVKEWSPKRSLASAGAKGQPVEGSEAWIRDWMLRFPRYAFSGLIDGTSPFTSLVKAVKAGRGGFDIKLQERTIHYGQLDHRSTRIYAERKPDLAKRYGHASFEIVYDPQLFLPMTITTSQVPPGQKEKMVYWTTVWQNNQKFDPKSFELP